MAFGRHGIKSMLKQPIKLLARFGSLLIFSLTAIAVLMVDAFARRGRADAWLPWVAFVGLGAAAVAPYYTGSIPSFTVLNRELEIQELNTLGSGSEPWTLIDSLLTEPMPTVAWPLP